MNWLNKFDEVITAFKDQAVLHWELAAVLGILGAILAIVLAIRFPAKGEILRKKARYLRYCHDCRFANMQAESCAIHANAGDKCGLIDSTAGMDFTTPTKL